MPASVADDPTTPDEGSRVESSRASLVGAWPYNLNPGIDTPRDPGRQCSREDSTEITGFTYTRNWNQQSGSRDRFCTPDAGSALCRGRPPFLRITWLGC